MNEDNLRQLKTGSEEEAYTVLKSFNSQHTQSFAFPDLTKDSKQKLVEGILARLSTQAASRTHVASLETLRIVSREKAGLEVIANDVVLKALVHQAGLDCMQDVAEGNCIQEADTNVIVEAQKCLCNIIFNSKEAQRVCSANGCVEGIVQRLKTYKTPSISQDVKFYDMRMLFLLTALCSDTRPKIQHDLHGFTYLIEVLDLTLRDAEEEENRPLKDTDVDLCCEVLKILFNITLQLDKNNLDEEEEAHFMRLVSVLHDLLVCRTASKEKRQELQSHTVNLLTNMPKESYEELLTPLTDGATNEIENKEVEYDGKNMEAIVILLDFLNTRLDVPKQSLKEGLCPILHCMCEVCRANRSVRKFCRIKILPYMRDEVKRLPEEGMALRNKLCKLFTNPVTEVKHLAADLLFVLCKENVQRFVKYTGFGNAAGLLAERGLMCGGRGAEYSSPSEDSDTEEYTNLQDSVNPVTGRWEQPRPDPMAGMTKKKKVPTATLR